MRTRVLVVDDEVDVTEFVKIALESFVAYEVCTVNDSKLAVQTAREFDPDVIVLDVMMPEPDGSEVAALLRADRHVRDVPVLFLTALVSQAESRDPRFGMDRVHYLPKPVDVDDLTTVEIQSRQLMVGHLEVYRAHAPGFEQAYLMLGAPGRADQPFEARLKEWRAANPETLAPPEMAAVLDRQSEAASETPTANTATVSAAVTGRITIVPSRRRRTVRAATYDESARRRADQRTQRPETASTSSPTSSPAATASRIGRARSVASGFCGLLRLAAVTSAAAARAIRARRMTTTARPALAGRRTPAICALSGSLTASRTTTAATIAVTTTTPTTARALARMNGTGRSGTSHRRASSRAPR